MGLFQPLTTNHRCLAVTTMVPPRLPSRTPRSADGGSHHRRCAATALGGQQDEPWGQQDEPRGQPAQGSGRRPLEEREHPAVLFAMKATSAPTTMTTTRGRRRSPHRPSQRGALPRLRQCFSRMSTRPPLYTQLLVPRLPPSMSSRQAGRAPWCTALVTRSSPRPRSTQQGGGRRLLVGATAWHRDTLP